jgi:hypothetical protein
MTIKLIDAEGNIVRTVYNVRGIEQPGDGKRPHPASWWLLMETSDTPVAIGKQFRLLVTVED